MLLPKSCLNCQSIANREYKAQLRIAELEKLLNESIEIITALAENFETSDQVEDSYCIHCHVCLNPCNEGHDENCARKKGIEFCEKIKEIINAQIKRIHN